MRIDRDTYAEYFTKHNTPSWNCSSCNKGKVHLKIEDLTIYELSASVQERENDAWEPNWVRQHFTGSATCNNSKCTETYVVSGESRVVDDYDGEYGVVFTECYYPNYIFPTLNLFELPKDTPYEVVDSLQNSFRLYWFDKLACANAIRSCVETTLTDKKVAKTELVAKTKKRKSLSLHRRIEIFEGKNPEVSNYLMAIKWIGNAGSHADEVYSEDLLDAFDLLSYALNKLYSNHDKEIKSIAKSINKRKKPLH